MSTALSTSEVLRTHLELCDETCQMLLEENRHLKRAGQPPDEALLSRKRRLLGRLDASLVRLRDCGAARASEHERAMLDKAQQIVLKALLLDRENEQLLLKCTMLAGPPPPAPKPAASHVRRAYRQ